MAKKFIKKLTNKGASIKYQIAKELSGHQMSKSLGMPKSTMRYFLNRHDVLETTKPSKFPKKYIDEIYCLTSNNAIGIMPGDLIAIKINKKFKKIIFYKEW